jgi:uncharacterized membrane protein
VAALALVGCAVSSYLALYQAGVVHTAWDPFFGRGSAEVLTSPLSRALPVPDAAFGAVAYAVEAVLELAGPHGRWRTRPWLVLAVGATAAGFAVASLGLVVSQPLLTGTWCTLCLTSAAVSFAVAALVREEVVATVRHRFARSPERRMTNRWPPDTAGSTDAVRRPDGS